jgi:hypothetical protein
MVSEHVPNWAATPWQKPAETAKAAGLPRRFQTADKVLAFGEEF